MKNIKIILLFVFLAGILSTCKKYPEGPIISFKTKMARVVGSWNIGKYTVNGSDSTQALLSRVPCERPMRFEKPKGGNVVCYFVCSGAISIDGLWSFEGNKEKLHIKNYADTAIKVAFPPISLSPNSPRYINWDIIRLTNKEMWLKVNYNNAEYYVELKR